MLPYRFRYLLILATILTGLIMLSGCEKNPGDNDPPATGDLDFTHYVALGNSLTAGVSNGALYEAAQRNSFPNLIARVVEMADFQQPLMADSGFSFLPTEGRIVINPLTMNIRFSQAGTEANGDLDRAFNNLGIPAIRTRQMYTATTAGEADDNHFVDKILRNHGRSAVDEALTLDPTVMTIWIGNNDILEAAVQGMSGAGYTPPELFAAQLDTLLMRINAGTDAPLIAANIPDITQVPYFTSIPPYLRHPETHEKVYIYGVVDGVPQQLTEDDYVLFFALPAFYALQDSLNNGVLPGPQQAISDTLVLDAGEAQEVRDIILAYNQTLANALTDGKFNALVDIHTLFDELRTAGYNFENGLTYTPDLLGFDSSGNIQLKLATTLFSLDGLHPNSLGYAVIANAFIEVMNVTFSASIPLVKLTHLQ
ncbi:MAG: hypothetical protein K9N11_02960 [Lentisphaeria bacterium]|nr:hypothetical protein [Candidatus Neomarinimicrobiota bacterium]MCF7841792.1 hypothetical protein [Lentisphaeria bacterium]